MTDTDQKKKVIVITGGTGGIGYAEALDLAMLRNTVIITGRNRERGEEAVKKLKSASGNDDIHLFIGDVSQQAQVRAMAAEIMGAFPAIDELINNAGQLTVASDLNQAGDWLMVDGIEKDFAVNVVAPVLLSRELIPALKQAQPTGRVQITSGGLAGIDDVRMDDLEAKSGAVGRSGIRLYSHTKRVMEAAALALAREFQEHNIAVNVIGGGSPGATAMTSVVGFSDLPCFFKCCYPCFSCVMAEDGGKSAKMCGEPCVWGATASLEAVGTGNYFLTGEKSSQALSKTILDTKNQDTVLAHVDSLIKPVSAA
jgi:NAD(P)-dependent dehydrogenase (short-subunit alcohol dehydrogenase family)